MEVRLYANLRPLVGGRSVTVPAEEGDTVSAVLHRLVEQYPRLQGQLLTPDGAALLPHVNVFIAGRSVKDLQGLGTIVQANHDLAIFPPVMGG